MDLQKLLEWVKAGAESNALRMGPQEDFFPVVFFVKADETVGMVPLALIPEDDLYQVVESVLRQMDAVRAAMIVTVWSATYDHIPEQGDPMPSELDHRTEECLVMWATREGTVGCATSRITRHSDHLDLSEWQDVYGLEGPLAIPMMKGVGAA